MWICLGFSPSGPRTLPHAGEDFRLRCSAGLMQASTFGPGHNCWPRKAASSLNVGSGLAMRSGKETLSSSTRSLFLSTSRIWRLWFSWTSRRCFFRFGQLASIAHWESTICATDSLCSLVFDVCCFYCPGFLHQSLHLVNSSFRLAAMEQGGRDAGGCRVCGLREAKRFRLGSSQLFPLQKSAW